MTGASCGTSTARRRLRNEILRARDIHDYSFVDWLYSGTALTPDEEPARIARYRWIPSIQSRTPG